MAARAIVLLSGGLDSILATRLIKDQGIEIEAVNFLTVFCKCTSRGKTCLASTSAAASLGIALKVFEVSKEYINIVKAPRHGYGRNLNPCLDCRIFIFRKAGEYMRRSGASFIVTGEVLGERPMSQRMEAMHLIEKESGLSGFIVRPLCAKLMEPTMPEKQGLVDREKLLKIQGRSRKPQIQIAQELGIDDYPCPSGGCLLTDKGFAERMRDLMRHNPDFTVQDIKLLKLGRHFRLGPNSKLIIGRDEEENAKLLALTEEDDLHLSPVNIPGPIGIGRGSFRDDYIDLAARILARYSDIASDQYLEVEYRKTTEENGSRIMANPLKDKDLIALRI
jgi:tRNA U34 2-thiouridine synthase MnmA/TrmU